MEKLLIFGFLMTFLSFLIKPVFAENIVFVNVSSVYRVTGETINGIARYTIDLQKTGEVPPHGESNFTIFDENFPRSYFWRRVAIVNTSGGEAYIDLGKANSMLIENGPGRVHIKYENFSSSYPNAADCALPQGICWNWTAEFYFYPKYYIAKYTLWGNFTYFSFGCGYDFPIPYRLLNKFDFSASYLGNGTYYNATSTPLEKSYTSINTSVMLVYNNTGHNKTFLLFSLPGSGNFTYAPFWLHSSESYYSLHGRCIYESASSRFWTYGMLFADSGNKSLEENYTVWLGFKDQWFDFYYPASVSPIKGSYEGRDNITATYNFTVDSSGLLRFNFSTNGIKHFLPVFHIKDITSTASSYAEHIWYKNYSKPNPQWEKLNNWTDFVIQDGNSSYFGYNYILLLINKTLGSDYEFWISNSSDPAGIFKRKIINWNNTLMIWNDTNQTSAFTLKYSITGLKPNCYYNVYNNSVLTYSMLYTNSQGNLPSFTIYLDGEKEIKVEEYPVVSIVLSDELVRGIFFTNKTGAENNVQYPLDLNDWNNASWNYNSSDNNKRTEYWIKNNGTTPIDICQKGENDLTCYPGEPCGSFAIAIANVSWSNSTYNNITYPEYDTSKRLALTYSTNKAAYSLSVSSSIYLRYWLFAPPSAPSGKYNTSIVFKAVKAGNSC